MIKGRVQIWQWSFYFEMLTLRGEMSTRRGVLEYQVDIIILLKVLEHSTFLVYRLSSLLYVSTGLQRNKLQTLLHSKTNQSANIFYNNIIIGSMS